MAYAKAALKKMKGKAPSKPDMDEGQDPAFEIPGDSGEHEEGKGHPALEGGTDDSDMDERTGRMAREGDLSPEKHGEGHEDKHDALMECSDEDLLKELKRRGHPAGKHAGEEHEAEHGADAAQGEHSEEEAEEYAE